MKRERVLLPSVIATLLLFATGFWSSPERKDALQPVPSPTPIGALSSHTWQVGRTTPSSPPKGSYAPGELIVRFKRGANRAAMAQVQSKLGVSVARLLLLPDYSVISVPLDKDPMEVAASLRKTPWHRISGAEPIPLC